MGIDVKETGATLWKVLGFSMNMTIKFMRNQPILSGVSLFLLALYVILPSLFFFLLYSSPVLACGVVYAREKMGLSFPSSNPKSCGGEKDVLKSHLRQQRSVRRNARMQVEEWDSQTSEEDKDKVILTSLYNDLLGRTPHFEESPKAIETEVVEDNEKSLDEEESSMSSRDLGYLDVQEPNVCNCEINEEKEEMSNANEHMVSEIDRDKRLESLIARRRTKRLFKLALHQHNKLQDQETSSPKHNNNNLHVNVPRKYNNNSFEKRRNHYPSDDGTVMGLQVPSSAPSVMSQARNPFDIPYDPQEERPILSGDSFDQEFSFLDHKDMFFSRHESFSRFDVLSPEHPHQCMNSPSSTSDITTNKKRLDFEDEHMDHNEQNTTEDGNSCVEGGELEVKNETDSNNEVDDDDHDDDDSSCSEESESEHNRFNKAELKEAISHTMDNHPSFLVNQARNGIPTPLPRGLAPPKLDDNNMFYSRRRGNSHSRTFSMASDMQVEVSDIGSPPTTVDWLDEWSNDGESYIYDTDIDREVICGEESRNRVSSQCDESKEENSWLETRPVMEQEAEESFDQKISSLSDVSKPSSGLLFHTSVSLSSINEEPEVLTKLVEHEVVEEKGPEQEKGNDECAKPIEVDKIHDVLEASSSSQPYIELLEDYANADNGSGVFLLQIQDSNNSTFDESADHVEEESIVLEDTHNSQDSQPWTQQGGLDSSEGISPRTLEITQQLEHDNVIYPNTVSQDIAEDIFAVAAAKDSTTTENNDEEDLKPDEQVIEEAVEKYLELSLQPMHHNTGLIAKEDDEGSNTVNRAVQSAETKTATDRDNL